MPRQIIDAQEIYWEWEEAFDKFGFGDGDGWNGTDIVADFIQDKGYEVECDHWGIHNYMIFDIKLRGESIYTKDVDKGYDKPSDYLPRGLVKDLQEKFSE